MTGRPAAGTVPGMGNLFFDVVTLTADGVRTPDGLPRTFAELGIGAGQPLGLYARELTVQGVPTGRTLTLVADRLVPSVPLHVGGTGTPPRIEVWAQHVDGALSVRSAGVRGPVGAAGPAGSPAVWGWEVITPVDDGGPVVKPVREKVLRTPAGKGGPGGPGGPGGAGGTVRISYVTATVPPGAEAPGGGGGPGGPGGPGGAGHGFPAGPRGVAGSTGPAGPAGTATVTAIPAPDFWTRHAGASAGASLVWGAHRLKVAEYHYRRGTADQLALARLHLGLLVDRAGVDSVRPRARRLLQQLFEGTTYAGLPRDVDVSPDVGFVGQDNAALYQTALQLLGQAQTIAGTVVVQEAFAGTLRVAAAQGANTLVAAKARIDEAGEHLSTAVSGTDVAQGRVTALDARITELQKAISDENASGSDTFGMMLKVVAVGAAIAGVATGVGAGIGAVVALGSGFAALSKTAGEAKTMYELVTDVKKKLDSKDMSGFTTSINDIGNVGKSIFHLGKIVGELSDIGTNHPSPKLRDLAQVQRERILLLKEVALHRQMEKEAQLGVVASTAERDAVAANITLNTGFAATLDRETQLGTDPVLRSLITSVRQLLDLLSIRLFRTVRAKEIYLGLDPVEVVRHDLGHLHPDREQLLRPVDQVREITQLVPAGAATIIEWSSLVDQMEAGGDLSLTPVPFWFGTEDAAHLEAFRSTRRFAFRIPIEDLLEENGSQIYEAKFDGVTIVLHGATMPGSGQSVRLKLLGRWSFRRRPDLLNPSGLVVEQALPPREVHLSARRLDKAVEAVEAAPLNPRAPPRVLRPLAGWPPKPVPARGVTPVPARGWTAYGYGGGVTAVGARLI